MFRLEGVQHHYHAGPSLRLPDWSAPQGAQRLIIGPSGSGKSTLLHLLAGVLRPSRGRVVVADHDLAEFKPGELDRFRGRQVVVVFQRLHLLGALSVAENLLIAQRLAGLPEDAARVAAVLSALGIEALAGVRPRALSFGQAQRAAIGRALVNRPRLVLADEPTSALDDESCATALDLLLEHTRREGATLVIATHDGRVRERVPEQLTLARPA